MSWYEAVVTNYDTSVVMPVVGRTVIAVGAASIVVVLRWAVVAIQAFYVRCARGCDLALTNLEWGPRPRCRVRPRVWSGASLSLRELRSSLSLSISLCVAKVSSGGEPRHHVVYGIAVHVL